MDQQAADLGHRSALRERQSPGDMAKGQRSSGAIHWNYIGSLVFNSSDIP